MEPSVIRYMHVILRTLMRVLRRVPDFFWSRFKQLVNYAIYYCRRIFLFQTDQQARKMNDKEYESFLKGRRIQDCRSLVINISVSPENISFKKGALTEENKHVNALWIGSRLSKIELLTLQSFVDHGHVFHLWLYDEIENELPDGIVLENANEIIPREKVFRYKHVNKYGHGKGSVSGFSDIFRYKLLYEKGGWWTDMDVTCLKPLNSSTPYFFRKHHELEMVGNVMKCPPHSALMLACYEEALREVDENNTDWHKPIEILNKHVFANNLQQYIFHDASNADLWNEIVEFVIGTKKIPGSYFFIHWMNEEWRSREIDKNNFRFRSVLGESMINAGLLQKPVSKISFWLNDFRHLVLLRIYYYS